MRYREKHQPPEGILDLADEPLQPGTGPPEDQVAFFGAVDSRAHLYLSVVSLLSVQRFHPEAGYFMLVPGERAAAWAPLMRAWVNGSVEVLPVPAAAAGDFGVAGADGYSRMTFHRHRVPELLVRRGYEYSINLDPDVLCLRPWDFRALVPISLVSGRRVGRGSRMVGWMQARLDSIAARQGSPATSLASLLNRTLGISARRLELTSELNGGVLVFNNLRLTRVRWLSRCVAAYAGLREVIEGDQDLIALILAADGSLPRVNLPTVYNYAYRRDRDRLPPPIGRRIRHGFFARAVVNIHFVRDGKPWQRQNLTDYPMYLVAARLQHVDEWRGIARELRPSLVDMGLSAVEQRLLGPDGLAPLSLADGNAGRCVGRQRSARSTAPACGAFGGLADGEALRQCRCFLRGLSRDKLSTPAALLGDPRGTAQTVTDDDERVLSKLKMHVSRDRKRLLVACGGAPGMPAPAWEREVCARDWEELERARGATPVEGVGSQA